MSTETIIDNEFAILTYHRDEKIVHHQFHRALDSENLRLVLNTGIDLLRDHNAIKWLSDNHSIGAHKEEDGKWINDDWLPRVIASGWKYWALVVPDDVKARMNMIEFVDAFYNQGVRVMVFTNVEQAKTWLENVDHR